MSGLYGIWCPVCKAEINSVTRGIPSMGICKNGHKTDRRDCLYREPDTITDPAQIRADALREALAMIAALETPMTEDCAVGHEDAYRAIEALIDAPPSPPAVDVSKSYQSRVKPWLDACFGPEIASDKTERNHRFLEEALELVQSGGCTASEAHQLVDYVYGRPVGEMGQEIGGVMNTLAALCLANGFDMHSAGEIELTRVWTMVEKIRAKQAAKPKHSPMPVAVDNSPAPDAGGKEGV